MTRRQSTPRSSVRERVVETEIARLPPDEAALLRMRFGLRQRARTIAEIATLRGLTRAQVRRLQARALKRLRRQSVAADGTIEWDEV